jgi:hypothetical protein
VKWQFDTAVLRELSADCLASVFMVRSSSAQGLTDDEIDTAVSTLLTLRDPESLKWTDPRKHGAGFQRIAAFTAGTTGVPGDCRPDALHVPRSPTAAATQTATPPTTVPSVPGVPASPMPSEDG